MATSDYYALGIPLFLVVLGAEYWAGRRAGRKLYHPFDTFSNLGCFLGSLVVGLGLSWLTIGVYDWAHAGYALFRFPEGSIVPHVLALIGVDFLYYWWHRAQHRVNALWVIHSVHHHSEDYNLGVGLRVPWFSDLTAILFFWPLPLLGIPSLSFFLAVGILSLYNLFLHTQMIAGSGPFGRVFLTPSLHRVHHGRDAGQADCNFGTVFSIWDRLFGTLRTERTEVRFGLTRPYASWNPVRAQVEEFGRSLRVARAARRPLDRLRFWWKLPGWIPEGAEDPAAPPPVPEAGRRFDHRPPGRIGTYVLVHGVLLFAAFILLALFGGGLETWQTAMLAVLLLSGLASLGGLADNRRWAGGAEALRLFLAVLVGGGLAWQARRPDIALAIAGTGALLTAWFAVALRSASAHGTEAR